MKRFYHLDLKILVAILFVINTNRTYAQNLKLHYGLNADVNGSTQVLDESGNGINGSLLGGATISTFDNTRVIDLGTSNGYVDLSSQFGQVVSLLTEFSVMVKLYIPSTSDISNNGNFVWSFSNSDNILNDAKGCLFFSAKNTRYAITPTNYVRESGIDIGAPLTKGKWLTLIYVQRNGTGKIFINGQIVKAGEITMSPSELGETPFNYLGRSCYNGDSYLSNAKIADFRVYDGPLSTDKVEELSGLTVSYYDATVLAKFDFNTVQDSAGNYTGVLKNGAELVPYGTSSVLKLGSDDGYFDFSADFGTLISQLDSFSISTTMLIPNSTIINSTGNFIWTFANSADMASDANGNIFFGTDRSRYVISKTHWAGETSVLINKEFLKGKWVNLTYTQRNNTGKIYIDGNLMAQGPVTLKPKDLGATPFNFLGRSCYASDNYLQSAWYDNFILFRGELKESDIWNLCTDLDQLNDVLDSITLIQAMGSLTIPHADSVRSSILLPSVLGDGVKVSWTSENSNVVSDEGLVTRPSVGHKPVVVTLNALLKYHNVTNTKPVQVTVLPRYSSAESLQFDLDNLVISGNTGNIRNAVHLPISTEEGSVVTWESDSPEYLNDVGQVVQLSPNGSGKKKVVLTAILTNGEETAKKTFEIWVAEDENREAYLFAYFTGNDTDGEQIRFAVSNDGYNYTPLNNGNRIVSSDTISLKKGVRDPHILRGADGKTFYMVVTDMKSAEGWSSNRGIVLLKSDDLIHWTHSTVHFPDKWPSVWSNVLRVWAPQTIYDPEVKKYMVYFSLYTGDDTCPYDRIYYCYANSDFTDLEGEPQLLFDKGSATIDGDIVYLESDSLYYFFFKNESLGGISQVTSRTLTPAGGASPGSQWGEPTPPVQQTDKAVEGSGVFRLINSDKWVLMYDCYTSGHYQYCVSTDLKHFTYVRDNYEISARHGTTITVTREEIERLIAKWSATALSNTPQGARNIRIKENGCNIDTALKTIDIAVGHGTRSTSFDPMLFASPGTVISPSGPQDFSNGNISYSFIQNGMTDEYKVSVAVEVNPLIPGFHADPEILYSHKTERFYIYPTTDGYPGWGGYSFDVFSSPDLVNWINEGTFLDLSSSQVYWASGNAWAPCIEEKQMSDGSYRYFFYFSGNAGIKKIGVAVANDPTGPFIDSGSPMISDLPSGIGGQLIDGDVFTDPVSGKSYFYYGNGFMAVAELNEDMITLKENTVKVITPYGGSLSDYAYREAPYVFYRNGIYYFLWSVDDTGSDNYHVAYGTSSSPTGPITVASSPIVIIQDAGHKIYGTGHNSILQIPDKDEWYIVYHRINARYLNNSPGTHREVCMDKLEFNPDGTIMKTIPTRRGIDPVVLKPSGTGTSQISLPEYRAPEGDLVDREIYDLYGRLVKSDLDILQRGIYIVREIYENKAVKTYKYLAKI